MADDGRQPHLPGHAARAPGAPRGARRRAGRGRAGRRAVRGRTATPSTRRCSPTRSGWRCMVVLETLTPAERLAFVLHDMFGVPFDEIASDRRAQSRRRRASSRAARAGAVGARTTPDAATLAQQRKVVDAFLAASRKGDFEALLGVLDPDVVFRGRRRRAGPPGAAAVRGARGCRESRARARHADGASRAARDRQRQAGCDRRLSPIAWCRWSRSRSSATA